MSAASPLDRPTRGDREPTVDLRLHLVSDPILDQLHRLHRSDDIARSLRRSAELAHTAARANAPGRLAGDLLVFAAEGTLAALLAIEVLAPVRHRRADDALVRLLDRPEPLVRRHAAWRLGARRPQPRAIAPLLDQLTVGGLDTLHAHRTLRRWATADPRELTTSIGRRLHAASDPAARARLVDLLGVVAGPAADQILRRIATDRADLGPARMAAIGALGQRPGDASTAALLTVATDDGELGAHAALALHQHPTGPGRPAPDPRGGLRLAQLVLAGGLDGQLRNGGRGDTGGVASLLVSLGEALARHPEVDAVLTIGRGTVTDALTGPVTMGDDPLSYAMITFGDDARPGTTADGMWEHLPTIERGIARALRRARPVDLLHVRMADVGTLARGTEMARQQHIPVAFSLAPDPHNVMQSMQARGELDGAAFLHMEARDHLWFRARLVERLARSADRLALFPRSRPATLAVELGLDPDQLEHRSAVVAEGIDLALVRRAEAHYADRPIATANTYRPPLLVLDDLARCIPPGRRGATAGHQRGPAQPGQGHGPGGGGLGCRSAPDRAVQPGDRGRRSGRSVGHRTGGAPRHRHRGASRRSPPGRPRAAGRATPGRYRPPPGGHGAGPARGLGRRRRLR